MVVRYDGTLYYLKLKVNIQSYYSKGIQYVNIR